MQAPRSLSKGKLTPAHAFWLQRPLLGFEAGRMPHGPGRPSGTGRAAAAGQACAARAAAAGPDGNHGES